MIIRKITDNTTVDFAAEELKKYLRMMMPAGGEVEILSRDKKSSMKHPNPAELKLGLMADFGLSTDEVEDPKLDDIVHIEVGEDGGILAGSNPRSVLFAAYRYLKENGCRFLFPGIDGEIIPEKNVGPVSYHHAASFRYRGQCDEGAQSQESVLAAIDFGTKLELNTVSIEFFNPKVYFDRYYQHTANPARRKQAVDATTTLQWTRAAEAEITKRGLEFVAIGHGWTVEAFGISSVSGWGKSVGVTIPEDKKDFIAMINGKRELRNGVAMNTQFCMSNPAARKLVVDAVVRYAKRAQNVSILSIGLADWQMNHCECPECVKKTPSDWYVVLLNEIDDAFNKEGIDQKLKFSMYSDTAWQPETERLQNPDRFTAGLAPITRSYRYSVATKPTVKPTPYVRNRSGRFDQVEEYYMRMRGWKEMGLRDVCWCFEYHFWKAFTYAPGILGFAKRIYEDVRSYKNNEILGCVEDMSKRCFFPNGLEFYVYCESLLDLDKPFEQMVDEYMSLAYGAGKEDAMKFFAAIDGALRQDYLETIHSKPVKLEQYHQVSEIANLERVDGICRELEAAMEKWPQPENRTQWTAVSLLPYYTEYLRGIAQAFILKAQGKDAEALKYYKDFFAEFGKYEAEIERYYDQHNVMGAWTPIFNAKEEQDM